MGEETYRAPARAKVNLLLRALGRRPDGYTEITTLFQSIDLADQVTIHPGGEGLVLSCSDPEIPGDERNLAHRAGSLFFAAAGLPPGAAIHLAKTIPPGTGLGGGSSDAAEVLVGLNALHGAPLEEERLRELALALGSDVPFFLRGGTSLGEGRGERLTPLQDLPPWPLVVVYPGLGISTAEVYRGTTPGLTGGLPEATMIAALFRWGDFPSLRGLLVNDLEEYVLGRYPPVREARDALTSLGAGIARMSGSGSCCFGVFEQQDAAREACQRLSGRSGWRVYLTRFAPARDSRWGVVKR